MSYRAGGCAGAAGRWLLALAVLLCLLGGRHAGVRAQAAVHGRVLVADGHVLRLLDLDAGNERDLLTLSSNDFVYSPVWLPDGHGFVYTVQHVFTGDPNSDYGTDIWLGDTGGGSHPIWTHDAKGADIDGLALSGDGRSLLFGYTRTDIAADGSLLDQVIRVDALDMQAGVARPFADGGLDPARAPDGSAVAYMDVSGADGDTDLWLRDGDGSHPRLLLAASPGFLALFSPRFSPDGRTILLSAAPDPAAASEGACCASLAWAHGFPQDLYTLPSSGGTPRRLTTLGEDQPSAAWSSDGRTILFNGTTGLYLINADGSGLARIADGYQHAQIAWLDH